jgi:hypothetical protein
MDSLSENLIAQNEIVADHINKTEKESVNKNEEKAGEQNFQE